MRTRDIDKEQLVKQKAIECIVKDGMEGFSMNKLAKACKISVATLYIYYKDRDDLIISIAREEGLRMAKIMLEDFDENASFEDGLRVQWKNRYKHMMENPHLGVFFDQLRSSSYHAQFMETFKTNFETAIGNFMHNVHERGEVNEMPFEAFWSVAYAPLYSLIRFHNEGYSVGGKPFAMSDKILWATFNLVVKALKN
ncbi:TetR/AcrR family transcriptional regulator [Mucilaginibacter sp. BJC16-A38]|uniref:TetR/AcrR family transcriptional regulator n=1 Tax=Mucilaginibacter phenanthrenivorans TaxID=1234842 RepID=UPI002157F6C4|nr:TetR/AcrR family transcriptional regulator [Mucilaginibacter phenanthrenivorans]MCR8560243.1 TetR/AcrR family transcriptional regulator [Mucilaginibacter phenanthrenivorans]